MPASNKRFGEIGVKVIARTSMYPLTVNDSPRCSAVAPQLRQVAGTDDVYAAQIWQNIIGFQGNRSIGTDGF